MPEDALSDGQAIERTEDRTNGQEAAPRVTSGASSGLNVLAAAPTDNITPPRRIMVRLPIASPTAFFN